MCVEFIVVHKMPKGALNYAGKLSIIGADKLKAYNYWRNTNERNLSA